MAQPTSRRSINDDDEVQIEFRLLPKEKRRIQSFSSTSMNSILAGSDDEISTGKGSLLLQQKASNSNRRSMPSPRKSLKHKAKQHRQLVNKYRENSEQQSESPTVGLPLKHERALTVNPCLGSPQRRQCQPLQTISEVEFSKSSSTATTTSSSTTNPSTIESVVVVTKKQGNVLVLESDGGNSVEAVSIRSAEKMAGGKLEESELSYTERLLQEDISRAPNISTSIQCEEKEIHVELTTNTTDYLGTLEELLPRVSSTTSSASSLGIIPSATRSSSSRFDVLGLQQQSLRASSDPGVASDRFVAVPFSPSVSCSTGPVPLKDFVVASDDDDDECDSVLLESQAERESSENNTNQLPLHHQHQASSSCGGESEWDDLVSEMTSTRQRRESDLSNPLVGRGRSNISATTYGTEEEENYKDLYRAFDLESAASSISWASHMSSFGKPLNIPVSQELQDMADEFSKNPTVLMKWLNPI